MKTLKPTDKINFGKNYGLLLEEIYKYQPSYIEWAIINIETFKIDIEEFEKLPLPTTIGYVSENFSDENKILNFNSDSITEDLLEYFIKNDTMNNVANVSIIKKLIEEGAIIDEIKEFTFPEKIKELNNNK